MVFNRPPDAHVQVFAGSVRVALSWDRFILIMSLHCGQPAAILQKIQTSEQWKP